VPGKGYFAILRLYSSTEAAINTCVYREPHPVCRKVKLGNIGDGGRREWAVK
jgi:hypothetical protein